jgi:hypothetical protein
MLSENLEKNKLINIERMVFTKKEEDYFLEHKDLWTKLLPYIEKMLKEQAHRTTIMNNQVVNPDEEANKKRDKERETTKKKVDKMKLSDVERLKILLGLAASLGDDEKTSEAELNAI